MLILVNFDGLVKKNTMAKPSILESFQFELAIDHFEVRKLRDPVADNQNLFVVVNYIDRLMEMATDDCICGGRCS